jgi:hypothetical protein
MQSTIFGIPYNLYLKLREQFPLLNMTQIGLKYDRLRQHLSPSSVDGITVKKKLKDSSENTPQSTVLIRILPLESLTVNQATTSTLRINLPRLPASSNTSLAPGAIQLWERLG